MSICFGLSPPLSLTLLLSPGCANLSSLETMSPQERKRQGYIHELMETEEKYVEDLQIVLEVTQRFFTSHFATYRICGERFG